MKLRIRSYLPIVIMVAMGAVIESTFHMKYWKTKFLPLVLGGITFLLASAQLWREIWGSEAVEQEKPTEEEREGDRRMVRNFFVTSGWVVGFSLAIYLVGFFIAIPVFVLSYMKIHGTSWRLAISMAACSLGLMYMISEPLVGIRLHRGIVFSG